MIPSDTPPRSDGLSLTAAADHRHPPTADGRPLRVLLVNDSAEDADRLLHALGRGGLAPVWERVGTADGLRAALDGGRETPSCPTTPSPGSRPPPP